jgi:hypothetical protein
MKRLKKEEKSKKARDISVSVLAKSFETMDVVGDAMINATIFTAKKLLN